MNWYGLLTTGMITGFAWGIVKKTRWAKYVVASLVIIVLGVLIAVPESSSYTIGAMWESIIRLIGFFIGTFGGEHAYDDYFRG